MAVCAAVIGACAGWPASSANDREELEATWFLVANSECGKRDVAAQDRVTCLYVAISNQGKKDVPIVSVTLDGLKTSGVVCKENSTSMTTTLRAGQFQPVLVGPFTCELPVTGSIERSDRSKPQPVHFASRFSSMGPKIIEDCAKTPKSKLDAAPSNGDASEALAWRCEPLKPPSDARVP